MGGCYFGGGEGVLVFSKQFFKISKFFQKKLIFLEKISKKNILEQREETHETSNLSIKKYGKLLVSLEICLFYSFF